jgi:hypothetical protein
LIQLEIEFFRHVGVPINLENLQGKLSLSENTGAIDYANPVEKYKGNNSPTT